MASGRCKCILVFSIGSFLLLLGAIVGGLWGIIYDKMLRMELVLTNTSRSYQMWKDIPIPIYMEFYMFNWTNAAAVVANSSIKPHFEQMGPYVFREYHHRVNMTWNSNDTITYQQVRSWHFQPDMSNGSLSDNVTNLNMVAATVAFQTRFMSYFKKIGVDVLMRATRSRLYVTKTVKELLFDGYDDKLLDLVKNITHKIPFKRFGYFVERNNSASADGIFNMWTGASDLHQLGMMEQWNYKHNTGLYNQPCDLVHGSSGDLWPPVTGRNSVHIFASDLCFSLQLYSAGAEEAHGLSGLRFVGDNRTLDNGKHFSETRCQCVGDCQPSGTLNASACRFGSPLFVSFPHFYLADSSYLTPLQGLKPDKNHEFAIVLQPETGMPLHVEAKLQLNVLVERWPHLSVFKHVPQRMYVPMLWFAQLADFPPDLAAEVRTLVAIPAIGRGTLFGIAGLGAFILLVGALVTWKHGWSAETQDHEPLLPAKEGACISE
ncbi:hypothetical protein R5R35_006398 [Gryllus longicercus]|uniref:Protein croquemort n=1 Tax=Gryllus longicercus TaxID=2509291 RepID=A0AAN9WQU3_9ORTH